MEKTNNQTLLNAQLEFHQDAREIQAYSTANHRLPLELEEPVRLEMSECLPQLLADTTTLRHLHKKSRWRIADPTFYELDLLFGKHNELLTWFFSWHLFNVPLAET